MSHYLHICVGISTERNKEADSVIESRIGELSTKAPLAALLFQN